MMEDKMLEKIRAEIRKMPQEDLEKYAMIGLYFAAVGVGRIAAALKKVNEDRGTQ